MEITIHARHASLAEDFREMATSKLKSMERFSVVIDRMEVEILHEQNPRHGKASHRVVLTSRGSGPLLRAESAAFNDLAAFDLAIADVEQQIRRIHERSKNHGRDSLKFRALAKD
ncbi:MAG: ribosome-associated translation inhibitor RaiA [Actinobacteria bacterium]|jgi:ribosomal subunit interface protein|nr:ribosome-associated translation inhibitor RaiA [Actinomycetota bacterium]NBP92102.1 ribosome-associated translation inhibitor RaiA [Actinomycetota bacterium]